MKILQHNTSKSCFLNTRPKVIDLFSGAGGFSLGFEQAGFDVVAAVEYDPVHMAIHEYNFPECASVCKDIREITGKELLDTAKLSAKDVHTIIGGPPCQGFSLIGKRCLDDPRNELMKEYTRIVLEVKPRYFVLENVAGLSIGKHQKFLHEIINLFQINDYQVTTNYKVLQASQYGVPQSRRRLFILGARKDAKLPTYPSPTTISRPIDGNITIPYSNMCPSVEEAIGDIPDVSLYENLYTSDTAPITLGIPSTYAKRLRNEIQGSNFGHIKISEKDVITSSMLTKHTEISIHRFNDTSPGETEPVSRFLRLHPQGIANTLRAGTASDRGAHTSPRPIHPFYPRVITVREAARLHSYPDWFRFHVTKWHGFRQIGNSVPPLLAQAVAEQILMVDNIKQTYGKIIPLNPDTNLLRMSSGQAEQYYKIQERRIPLRQRKKI